MKTHFPIIGTLIIVGALAAAWPQRAVAAVDDKDFEALKDLVNKQGQRIEQLEKAHEKDLKALDQTQKVHEEDQKQIEQLKQQTGEAQKTASEAATKADAAATANVPGPAATHNFTMVGDAEVQFGKVSGQNSGFVLADFAPIFLFRARDNVLFEAGFDITLQNNAPNGGDATTGVSLSFGQLDYIMNDYLTLVGGYMLLPLGTYTERGAGWINKIPDEPLPRAIVPANGAGIQFRGAVPICQSGQSFNYAVYGVNGPGSVDGTGNHDQLDLGGIVGF
jgi:hypothetical protein